MSARKKLKFKPLQPPYSILFSTSARLKVVPPPPPLRKKSTITMTVEELVQWFEVWQETKKRGAKK